MYITMNYKSQFVSHLCNKCRLIVFNYQSWKKILSSWNLGKFLTWLWDSFVKSASYLKLLLVICILLYLVIVQFFFHKMIQVISTVCVCNTNEKTVSANSGIYNTKHVLANLILIRSFFLHCYLAWLTNGTTHQFLISKLFRHNTTENLFNWGHFYKAQFWTRSKLLSKMLPVSN